MKHFTIATIILISTTSTAVSANVVHLANGVKIAAKATEKSTSDRKGNSFRILEKHSCARSI